MIFSSWGRLVDLYEQRILKLFSHFKIIHDPEFEVAANAAAKAMAAETAGMNAASWRTAAAKSTNARRIHQALQREIQTQNLEPVLRQIANQNAQLITKLPVQIRQEISRRAAELVREGARPAEVEKLIRQLRPLMIKSRVKLLARTEVSRAETALTQVRAERLGIRWYQWTTSQDQRVRASHRNMNKVLVAWDDPPAPEVLMGEKSSLGRYPAGACPNCFIGETLISSPSGIKTIWRAPYSGDLIRIVLEGGASFVATPNHPILTDHGWLPVSKLNIGGNLIQLAFSNGYGSNPNLNQDIASFEQIYRTHSGYGSHRSLFGLNFHGDMIYENIDEVSISNRLGNYRESQTAELTCEFSFTRPDRWIGQLIAAVALHVIDAFSSSWTDQVYAFSGAEPLHPNSVGFRRGAWMNSIFDQVTSHGQSRYTEMLSNANFAPSLHDVETAQLLGIDPMAEPGYGCFDPIPAFAQNIGQAPRAASIGESEFFQGSAGRYCSVRILDKISSKTSSGHVFTIESGSGWYGVTSAGIIAQNCRCLCLPLADLAEVNWPARVYRLGSITRMTRPQFVKMAGIPMAA